MNLKETTNKGFYAERTKWFAFVSLLPVNSTLQNLHNSRWKEFVHSKDMQEHKPLITKVLDPSNRNCSGKILK